MLEAQEQATAGVIIKYHCPGTAIDRRIGKATPADTLVGHVELEGSTAALAQWLDDEGDIRPADTANGGRRVDDDPAPRTSWWQDRVQ